MTFDIHFIVKLPDITGSVDIPNLADCAREFEKEAKKRFCKEAKVFVGPMGKSN